MPTTYRKPKSFNKRRGKRYVDRSMGSQAIVRGLPMTQTFVVPMTIRYEINTQSRFQVSGTDIALWANVCTIPGAFTSQPLFNAIKIKKLDLYGSSNVSAGYGGAIALQFADNATSTGGVMIASPVASFATAPAIGGVSHVSRVPSKDSIYRGWFNPNVVGNNPVFNVDCKDSQDTFLDVHIVGCVRNPNCDTSQAAPAAAWIWSVSGPTTISIAGTIVMYPLGAAVAAVVKVVDYPYAY